MEQVVIRIKESSRKPSSLLQVCCFKTHPSSLSKLRRHRRQCRLSILSQIRIICKQNTPYSSSPAMTCFSVCTECSSFCCS